MVVAGQCVSIFLLKAFLEQWMEICTESDLWALTKTAITRFKNDQRNTKATASQLVASLLTNRRPMSPCHMLVTLTDVNANFEPSAQDKTLPLVTFAGMCTRGERNDWIDFASSESQSDKRYRCVVGTGVAWCFDVPDLFLLKHMELDRPWSRHFGAPLTQNKPGKRCVTEKVFWTDGCYDGHVFLRRLVSCWKQQETSSSVRWIEARYTHPSEKLATALFLAKIFALISLKNYTWRPNFCWRNIQREDFACFFLLCCLRQWPQSEAMIGFRISDSALPGSSGTISEHSFQLLTLKGTCLCKESCLEQVCSWKWCSAELHKWARETPTNQAAQFFTLSTKVPVTHEPPAAFLCVRLCPSSWWEENWGYSQSSIRQ